jgi:hypothetical protein
VFPLYHHAACILVFILFCCHLPLEIYLVCRVVTKKPSCTFLIIPSFLPTHFIYLFIIRVSVSYISFVDTCLLFIVLFLTDNCHNFFIFFLFSDFLSLSLSLPSSRTSYQRNSFQYRIYLLLTLVYLIDLTDNCHNFSFFSLPSSLFSYIPSFID